MKNIEDMTAVELGQLVNLREISPTEVLKHFKDRIEKRNPEINAFTYTKFEDAFNEAKKIENKLANNEYVGPFAGVPICLKDFLPSKKGWHNSHGGVQHLVRVDDSDSMFYKAARSLGAIAVGKTNAPPFGFSGACQNKMYGYTSNPFDLDRTSGGSSGGTAAAVADGLVLLGEGGDAGGSIRIPAGWCNLFGYKPSLGTVPSYCRPDGWSATHPYCFNGCLTTNVMDSAIMLNHMAIYNPRDPISLPINSNTDFTRCKIHSIKDMKIGFTMDFDMFPVEECVKDQIKSALKQLEPYVETIDPISFNFKHSLEEFTKCWAWSISIDTALDLEQWRKEGLDLVRDYAEELTPEFISYNQLAANLDIHMFREFNEIRTDILDNFENVFENYDIIISPTACCLPMFNSYGGHAKVIDGIELNSDVDFIQFGQTFLVNFIGYPAASIPAGLVEDKWPIGMQMIGKQYRDEDIFDVAFTYEHVNPWNYVQARNR